MYYYNYVFIILSIESNESNIPWATCFKVMQGRLDDNLEYAQEKFDLSSSGLADAQYQH